MYAEQHTPWEPREMLVDTISTDLALASCMYGNVFCCLDAEEYLSIRTKVNWIIAEMMGYTRPFSNDSEDDDDSDCVGT